MTELLVVRHGIALGREDAAAAELDDRERPLTRRGRERTTLVAEALAKRKPRLDAIFTSPLRRARETAELLADACGGLNCVETTSLLPDADPRELAEFLSERTVPRTIAVVGHEPHLGCFVGWSLTGERRSVIELRKAGTCLLRFEGAPRAGEGRLIWLLSPALMRGRCG